MGKVGDRRSSNNSHVRISCIKYHSWSFVPKHSESLTLHESARQSTLSVDGSAVILHYSTQDLGRHADIEQLPTLHTSRVCTSQICAGRRSHLLDSYFPCHCPWCIKCGALISCCGFLITRTDPDESSPGSSKGCLMLPLTAASKHDRQNKKGYYR